MVRWTRPWTFSDHRLGGMRAALPPASSLRTGDFIGLTLFVLVNLFIRALNEALHRTRRRAEEMPETLWQLEERLRGIFTSATDPMITIDANQKITLFNEGAEVTFGYPAAEMIGRRLDRLLLARFREAHRQHVDA
jgi:PAS domain-containing protein